MELIYEFINKILFSPFLLVAILRKKKKCMTSTEDEVGDYEEKVSLSEELGRQFKPGDEVWCRGK